MKTITLIFSLISLASFGQYTIQNSQGPETLRVVEFVNQDQGYAAGNSGKIIKTIDGGDTWEITNSPTNEKIRSLSIVSNDIFYFTAGENVGAYYLYKSTDGGNTYQELTIPNSADPYSVDFIDAQTGFVSARSGGIYKTVDGGANWYQVTINNITNTQFVTPLIGYGHNVNSIYKTTDGGETWTYIFNSGMFSLGTVQFHTMFFSSEENGHIASEYYGQLVSSNDDFQTGVTNVFNWSILSIYFTSDLVGYATETTNPGDRILKTTDGGATWSNIYDSGQTLLDQHYINENLGWIVGSGGTILKYEPNASVDALETTTVQLYPNPATDEITISLKEGTIEGVAIYTNLGKEVLRLEGAQERVSLEALPSGMYHLVVQSPSGQYSTKLVKE